MKKLEPGMLCRVVEGDHKGTILTLVRFLGTPESKISGLQRIIFDGGDWWETDTVLDWPGHPDMEPDSLISASEIEPINPDHQPADEQWQEDFKRMLSGSKRTVRQ